MNARTLLLILTLAICHGTRAEAGVMDSLRGWFGLDGKSKSVEAKKTMPHIRVGSFTAGTRATGE